MDKDEARDLLDEIFADRKQSLRPELPLVVATIDELFARPEMRQHEFIATERGPLRWSWVDRSGKMLAVGCADIPGTVDHGHPYFMITQPIVPSLGSYMTTTNFVLGNTPDGIVSALTAVWVNHWGAYAGLTTVARRSVDGSGVDSGAEAAREISDLAGASELNLEGLMDEIDSIFGRPPGAGSKTKPN